MYIIMNQNSSTMSKIDPQTHLKSCIENGVRLKRQAELEAIESELDELYDIHDNFEMYEEHDAQARKEIRPCHNVFNYSMEEIVSTRKRGTVCCHRSSKRTDTWGTCFATPKVNVLLSLSVVSTRPATTGVASS
jgi:hypothetical protein